MSAVDVCMRKRLFLSEDDALAAIKRTMRRVKKAPALRVYRCPVCKGYHRTKARVAA